MIRADKVRTIARFELLQIASRPSYLLVTFGLPLFFTLIGGGMIGLQGWFLARKVERVAAYGVVDEADLLGPEVFGPDGYVTLGPVLLERMESEASALAALEGGELGAIYVVEADYRATGQVRAYAAEAGPLLSVRSATAEPVLARLLVDRLLRDAGVDDATRDRVLDPMEVQRQTVTREGERRSAQDQALELLVRSGAPFMLGVLLLTALLSASGYLVQTVALDKESKLVEVLLSSTDPDELLTGKLLGLGAAGLLQFVVWAFMVVGGAGTVAALFTSLSIPLPWEALALSPLFFVLGYLFIGSLMLATGSLGSSVPESQKLTLGWALLAVLPLMLLVILLEEPHGSVGKLLTILPFSAPLTVVVRTSLDPAGIAAWEILMALAVLLMSTWLSIRVGARLFRIGLLLSGSRPSWGELLRQARIR
ncbi:MAG: ABC transporter permease [Myxococcota bacterium]